MLHPAQHLAAAIIASEKAQAGDGDMNTTSVHGRRGMHAIVMGETLAFLLHPATPELPALLKTEAFTLLSTSAPVFGGNLKALLGGSGSSAGGGGAAEAARKRQQAVWEERATKTQAFQKLTDLTGLAPVKNALFELAEQVGGLLEKRGPSCLKKEGQAVEAKGGASCVRGEESTNYLHVAAPKCHSLRR